MSGTPADRAAAPPRLAHGDFVAAWREGRIRVDVDPLAARQLVGARLMLPYIASAVIGLGIGLVLWGWLWTGLVVGGSGVVVSRLVRRSAPGFLLERLAEDAALYDAALDAGALRLTWTGEDG